GIYAEWKMMKKDVIDFYPDVYVGRLACRNSFEVKKMVEKIITYETTTYGQDWFKRFVGVAGDTYPGDDDPYYEGELATEAAFNYLDGFEANYIWTSTGALTDANDIIDAISQGCGFLHFSGHGNPISWANHPPNDEKTWIGIDETQFMKLKNEGMYPVCIVGGCHNNQFNTSLANIIKGILEDGLHYFSWKQPYGEFWYNEWFPRCWGWGLTVKIDGGSIATIANTGYGYGEPGENCLNVRGRYMELQFFKSYSEGKDMLGETHGTGLAYYLNKFPPMGDKVDCKIVQQWELLGDPSLKIGGY
ncbi:MAG: C25 family cysteine peptidase, partial [Candidatus Thermoplasmatota archaeon]|nr:C25 family cysteine peptidase [Candidatus Thermoplasmatota archaeon]